MVRPTTKRDLSLVILVQTKLTPEMGRRASHRAKSKGLSVSAYVRNLIINDLEKAKGE